MTHYIYIYINTPHSDYRNMWDHVTNYLLSTFERACLGRPNASSDSHRHRRVAVVESPRSLSPCLPSTGLSRLWARTGGHGRGDHAPLSIELMFQIAWRAMGFAMSDLLQL